MFCVWTLCETRQKHKNGVYIMEDYRLGLAQCFIRAVCLALQTQQAGKGEDSVLMVTQQLQVAS